MYAEHMATRGIGDSKYVTVGIPPQGYICNIALIMCRGGSATAYDWDQGTLSIVCLDRRRGGTISAYWFPHDPIFSHKYDICRSFRSL